MAPAPCPLVLEEPARVGLLAAELVANRMRAARPLRLLLPTGRTPEGMYAALRERRREGKLPAQDTEVFQLDEYAGLGAGDERSYAAYLRRELGGLGLRAIHELDGTAADLDAEARRHQRVFDEAPIDLAVLGLGRDGHVAFDEPGSPADSGMRCVTLAAATREDAAAGFGGLADVPEQALTVGLRTLREARALILLVTGETKAPALRAMLQGPAGPASPASLLCDHPRLSIICDRAAASLLPPSPAWSSDRALVVLGHREPGRSHEHRVSAESHARLLQAGRLAERRPARLAVLTGWTSTGGLSEAEQMLTWWNEPDTPALLEVAGRDTAENASRTLPLLEAVGDIRSVTVVTSGWHLRAPYFFAPYRRHGLRVSFRPALRHALAPRYVAQELRALRAAPGQRRAAWA